MKTIDTILTATTALLAAASFTTAVIFSVWWNVATGAMFATLAVTMYNELKSQTV